MAVYESELLSTHFASSLLLVEKIVEGVISCLFRKNEYKEFIISGQEKRVVLRRNGLD